MSTAEDMRREFDAEFARSVTPKSSDLVDLLGVRFGGDPFAIRLREVEGVFEVRAITPAPSADPTFVGLVGLRAAVVPVFDLAALHGYPRSARCRWFVVAQQLGFGFETFDGHLRVPANAIAPRTIVTLSTVIAALLKKER
jgi:chemotaxis signal transduction protein